MRGDYKAVMFGGQRSGNKRRVLLPFALTALLLFSSLTADAQLTSIPGTAGELMPSPSLPSLSSKLRRCRYLRPGLPASLLLYLQAKIGNSHPRSPLASALPIFPTSMNDLYSVHFQTFTLPISKHLPALAQPVPSCREPCQQPI